MVVGNCTLRLSASDIPQSPDLNAKFMRPCWIVPAIKAGDDDSTISPVWMSFQSELVYGCVTALHWQCNLVSLLMEVPTAAALCGKLLASKAANTQACIQE